MPWINAAVFAAILLALAVPLTAYMNDVFSGERTFLTPILLPFERGIYRVCRIADEEMSWSAYAFAALALTLAGAVLLYIILRVQQWLPLNPQHFANFAPELAWNSAISFVTTTDWQFYAGENAASYFSQMAGFAWQNFLAGAIGLAIGIAVIRGFVRERSATLGNFWIDLTRGLLYVLLPLSIVFGLAFVVCGVPQNFSPYTSVTSAEHFAQSIPGGPVASQEAISLLGGNGGGFFAANTASPNINPNGVSNLLDLLAIWILPTAFVLLFGAMVRNRRAGHALLAAMFVIAFAGFAIGQVVESAGNPLIHALGVSGGNMEGKEVRFGTPNAGLSMSVASNSGTGAADFAYDSLMPIGGLVPMVNMQIGEVVFGGVGSGLYGMLVFAILTVFIAGLMVGRTPEYLGKKIERREVAFAMIAAIIFPAIILVATAISAVLPAGLATLGNDGPHGFSEILYAFSSVASNNGSAFAGLGPNLYYDIATGLVMLGGRYFVMIPTLALAGALAARPTNAMRTQGTFRTDNTMFVVLLIGVVLLFGALTFLPADALGPIAEHVQLAQPPAAP
ncbi:MAG TPA: potassium-transporting ATPase subunit KdpA [Candidatus Acidoferrum sp.]|nr:potassium-transporting ATPase subunit KdpA [Candidatus Acidoferrum sp.]